MTGNELILHQIHYLRHCQAESKAVAKAYADAQNLFEEADSKAGLAIIEGSFFDEDKNEEIKLTNDIARKAYKKEQSLNEAFSLNLAKEAKGVAATKVLVEISVLSALKQIAKDEEIDDELIAQYDILNEEGNE